RVERSALAMLAAWMGERFFRTFRTAVDADRGPFDALLTQRDHRVGVTLGVLWEEDDVPAAAIDAIERNVTADLQAADDTNAYALWVPPRVALPAQEPRLSDLRVMISRGLANLAPGERREVRIPAVLRLAKIDAGG